MEFVWIELFWKPIVIDCIARCFHQHVPEIGAKPSLRNDAAIRKRIKLQRKVTTWITYLHQRKRRETWKWFMSSRSQWSCCFVRSYEFRNENITCPNQLIKTSCRLQLSAAKRIARCIKTAGKTFQRIMKKVPLFNSTLCRMAERNITEVSLPVTRHVSPDCVDELLQCLAHETNTQKFTFSKSRCNFAQLFHCFILLSINSTAYFRGTKTFRCSSFT